MDWDRIAGNWAHWKSRVRERWGKLTDQQLDEIGGRRDELVGQIGELYDLSRAEVERQLRNWERNVDFEDFDVEDIVLDDEDFKPLANGRKPL